MDYIDYKTGKSITREQYIANGIERGELLYKYDCGCVIIQDRIADAYIVYCPKHKAAPDMYEALKELFHEYTGGRNVGVSELGVKADKALAKAEGEEKE